MWKTVRTIENHTTGTESVYDEIIAKGKIHKGMLSWWALWRQTEMCLISNDLPQDIFS